MKLQTLACVLCLTACTTNSNNKPNYEGVTFNNVGYKRCGLDTELVQNVMLKFSNRGHVNGARDENGDGRVSEIESFTAWDFHQVSYIMRRAVSFREVSWTNIDTCYTFHVTPHHQHEDGSMPTIWKLCRNFSYRVNDNEGRDVGHNVGKACRRFGTHEWEII